MILTALGIYPIQKEVGGSLWLFDQFHSNVTITRLVQNENQIFHIVPLSPHNTWKEMPAGNMFYHSSWSSKCVLHGYLLLLKSVVGMGDKNMAAMDKRFQVVT